LVPLAIKPKTLAGPPQVWDQFLPDSALRASRNQINLQGADGTEWSAPKEPAPHSLLIILDEDGGGRRDENSSEFGKDSLLTYKLSPSQINPQQDRGGLSHGGFKELGQDRQEDEIQEREQQEVAPEATGNKDGDDVEL